MFIHSTEMTAKHPVPDGGHSTDAHDGLVSPNSSETKAISSPSAEPPAPAKAAGKKTRYTICVKTSDLLGSGTEANVSVNLVGEQGNSNVIQLDKSENHVHKFQRNQSDIFFADMVNLGPIKEVQIWHDNKDIGPSWHLEYVEVCEACSNIIYHFNCNRWLSKLWDDGQIRRALPLSAKREKMSQLRNLKPKKSSKEVTSPIEKTPKGPSPETTSADPLKTAPSKLSPQEIEHNEKKTA